MKYYMELSGFEDLFVEVEDAWTMKELKEVTSADGEQYFVILRRKIVSLLIRDAEGKEIRDKNELTEDFIENVDVAVAGFLGTVLIKHIRDRRSLGGASVHPLSTGSESKKTKN